MYRIPSTLDSDLDYTESLVKKYKAGEITAGELKANRVPMGIYEQRKNHHHMLRVRCTGGLITPQQLAKVPSSATRSRPPTCISRRGRRYRFIMSTSWMLSPPCASWRRRD